MYPWLPWWPSLMKLPGAENLNQDIAPVTTWFPTTYELNFAGDRRIESDVVSNVASYGKQLGILTDALLALAGDSENPAVERLRDVAQEIERRKQWHQSDLEATAKDALERLRNSDRPAFDRLLSEFAD
ncbi:MAG: hypothetical protein E4G91_08980 [Candidatus Zixiibacteriota bacterium]|nr:MAG: hypothetical protein E4G91_08980 [candidate division Zixibacteria bacterium]